MDRCLVPGEAPEKGLPRLLSEDLAAVAGHLAAAHLAAPAEVQDGHVHELRKRLKAARATLRLLRPHLTKGHFRALDARLRALGRATGPARDAAVIAALLADLGAPPPPGDAARALWEEAQLAPLRAEAEALVGVLAAVQLDDEVRGPSVLSAGLRRTWRRCTERRDAALAGTGRPDPEAMHDWRKSVKRARDQLRLVEGAWPEVLGGIEDELDRLGEVLGDHHDLHVVAGHVDLGPALRRELEARSRALEAEAAWRGTRLFSLEGASLAAWVVEVLGAWTDGGGRPAQGDPR